MATGQTNDFDALREIVHHEAQTNEEAAPLRMSDEETRQLEDRLQSIAKAQQEASVALGNVILR